MPRTTPTSSNPTGIPGFALCSPCIVVNSGIAVHYRGNAEGGPWVGPHLSCSFAVQRANALRPRRGARLLSPARMARGLPDRTSGLQEATGRQIARRDPHDKPPFASLEAGSAGSGGLTAESSNREGEVGKGIRPDNYRCRCIQEKTRLGTRRGLHSGTSLESRHGTRPTWMQRNGSYPTGLYAQRQRFPLGVAAQCGRLGRFASTSPASLPGRSASGLSGLRHLSHPPARSPHLPPPALAALALPPVGGPNTTP